MTMRFAAMAVLCLALGGCKLFEPDVPSPEFITTVSADPPKLPHECHRKGDPKWTPLPPKGVDVRTSDVIRRDDRNESSFNSLERKRAICEAAIVASGQ